MSPVELLVLVALFIICACLISIVLGFVGWCFCRVMYLIALFVAALYVVLDGGGRLAWRGLRGLGKLLRIVGHVLKRAGLWCAQEAYAWAFVIGYHAREWYIAHNIKPRQ